MSKPLTPGDVVRYAKPEAGEEALTFVVIELRGDRVLIESRDFGSGQIAPQEAVSISDIERIEG